MSSILNIIKSSRIAANGSIPVRVEKADGEQIKSSPLVSQTLAAPSVASVRAVQAEANPYGEIGQPTVADVIKAASREQKALTDAALAAGTIDSR